MSRLEFLGCSKKRKRGEKVFKFKTFGEQGHPIEFEGSFLQNLKALLQCGHYEISSSCVGMQCWSFQLEINRQPPVHVLLFVIEEPLVGASAPFSRCKHCLYVGWGQQLICNKKYHFLLPSKDASTAPLNLKDNMDEVSSTTLHCNFAEAQGHTMHGIFHSNGIGHLLCINGVESGSELAGVQVMDFWERLCTGLRARRVSLNDVSQKRGMDLRLLHGLAYGEPWFARWGYRFGRGSFGITLPVYKKAIEAIQGTPLSLFVHHLANASDDLLSIFSKYQSLSDHALATLGDLFHFMLELASRLPKENAIDSCNPSFLLETSCRWSPKRVEMATRVIVEALKSAEFRWVSRQDVRDAARSYIGDTGLLDFVLKSLGNHVVGNYLVRRSLNPVTKVLEYCLEDMSKAKQSPEVVMVSKSNPRTRSNKITRVQLTKDMFYLYKYIFKEQKLGTNTNIGSKISLATRIILDSKYLIKEYTGDIPSKTELGLGGKLKLFCTVKLRGANHDPFKEWMSKPMPPYEGIILKENATINELKVEVERTFRELYWGLKSFTADTIVNLNVSGSEMVFRLVEVGRKLVFEGSIREQGMSVGDMYESGADARVVDCGCGAKEDDGERMICCDVCEVWQHTWCVQIPNSEAVPDIFLCKRCEQEIMLLPSLP